MILAKYIETRYDKDLKRPIRVELHGIWDGEKAVMFDKERTTVRKKEWLELIDTNELNLISDNTFIIL